MDFFRDGWRIADELKITDSELYNSLIAHDYASSESKRLENYLLERVDRNKWGDFLCKILVDIENDFSHIIFYNENEIPWFDRIMNNIGSKHNDCIVLETVFNSMIYLAESLGVTNDGNERLNNELWKVRHFLKNLHPDALDDSDNSNEHTIKTEKGTIYPKEESKKKRVKKVKPLEALISIGEKKAYLGRLRERIASANGNTDAVMQILDSAVVNKYLSEWPSASVYDEEFGDLVEIKESTYKYKRSKYSSFSGNKK